MSTVLDNIGDATKYNGFVETIKLIDCCLEATTSIKDREDLLDQLKDIHTYFVNQNRDIVEKTFPPESPYSRHWKLLGEQLHNLNATLTAGQPSIEIDFRKEALDRTLSHIKGSSLPEAEKVVLVLVNFYSSIVPLENTVSSSNQPVNTKSRLFDILLLATVDDVMLQLEQKGIDFSVYFTEDVINRLDENSKDPIVQLLINIIRAVAKKYGIEVSPIIKCIQQRDALYNQDEKMSNLFQLLHEYGQKNDKHDIDTFLRNNNMPLLTQEERNCYSHLFSKYLIKDKEVEENQNKVMQIVRNDGVFTGKFILTTT